MRWMVVAAFLLATAGCASESPNPTAEPDPGVERLVVPAATASLPDPWTEKFAIPYGKGPARLGTSQGGDSGGTVRYGPEYGAPGPDGTWWFLDLAKDRIAHYDATGHYLGQVRNTTPWTLPHVLADGTFYAVRFNTDTSSQLLRLRDGNLDVIDVDGAFFPSYDDGVSLYGSVDGAGSAKVDPGTGAVDLVDAFTTPSGTPFSLSTDFDRGRLTVRIPGADVTRSLPILTSSGAKVHTSMEVRAGADGVLHLFLSGYGEGDSDQLVGYTSISASGKVAPVEGLPDPFSASDPGSPAHLVMAPGSSSPMLVYVLEDGVHVYERA